jgi:hypothetical protein
MVKKINYKIYIVFLFFFELAFLLYNKKVGIYQSKEIKDRVLVYSCCDEVYSHYIPIFCSTILRTDKLKLIDIEIGTNLNSLSEKEEKAINYLRKKYNYAKIIINYNVFIKNKTGIYYNDTRIKDANSVRFISQPFLKNKYVYITDIDLFILVDNFYLKLIDDMTKRKCPYSNIVRRNTNRLSGLHFTKYDAYYPIPKQKYYPSDEILLYNIVKSKGIKIDKNTNYRPLFGIHASPNRPTVKGTRTIGWEAEKYKFDWINYCKSNDFKYIYPLLDLLVINKIKMLNNYYGINLNDFIK